MPDGIYRRRRQMKSMELSYVCFLNQWNPLKHQPVQIRVRIFRASSTFWLWLTCQMWTELGQRATIAALWLAFCPAALHSATGSPLNVIITRSFSLPPLWGLLFLLLTYCISNQPLLALSVQFTLSPIISPWSVPFPLYITTTKMSTSVAAGFLWTQEPRGTQLSSWMV